jgi:DNA-binding HxlR family transcriptional regulator
MVERRRYGQFCGLASALDALGERWTLLIVRELLLGPLRFTELSANLPGLGPNLLAERLRGLVELGVVQRCAVAGDARGKLYELTALGEQLRRPIVDLARWGLGFVEPEDAGVNRAEWGLLALRTMIRPDVVAPVEESYEIRLDERTFHIAVADSAARVYRGPAAAAAVEITADARTFVEIGARTLNPFQAVVSGRLKMTGAPEAISRCVRLLGLNG